MSSSRSAKRELERLRKEKAARKLAKRKARSEAGTQAPDEEDVVPQDVLLDQLAALHRRFGDDEIGPEDFELERERLLAQLRVD